MTLLQRKFLFWGIVLIFIILAIPIVYYSFGYRFSFDEFKLVRAGGLYITSVPSTGTRIFIDDKLIKETSLLSRNVFLQGLTPRPYSIRVERDGYHTWEKSLPVLSERVLEIKALLVRSSQQELEIIERGDFVSLEFADESEEHLLLKDKEDKKHMFSVRDNNFVLPDSVATSTQEIPEDVVKIVSEFNPDGFSYDASQKRIVYWSDKSMSIRWLRGESYLPLYTDMVEQKIFESSHPIRSAAFYPAQEVIIAAYSNAIMVIELDGRGRRNLFPLYKGKNPSFAIVEDLNKIFILDDGNFISIPLL